jgi:hypothetical protein
VSLPQTPKKKNNGEEEGEGRKNSRKPEIFKKKKATYINGKRADWGGVGLFGGKQVVVLHHVQKIDQ